MLETACSLLLDCLNYLVCALQRAHGLMLPTGLLDCDEEDEPARAYDFGTGFSVDAAAARLSVEAVTKLSNAEAKLHSLCLRLVNVKKMGRSDCHLMLKERFADTAPWWSEYVHITKQKTNQNSAFIRFRSTDAAAAALSDIVSARCANPRGEDGAPAIECYWPK